MDACNQNLIWIKCLLVDWTKVVCVNGLSPQQAQDLSSVSKVHCWDHYYFGFTKITLFRIYQFYWSYLLTITVHFIEKSHRFKTLQLQIPPSNLWQTVGRWILMWPNVKVLRITNKWINVINFTYKIHSKDFPDAKGLTIWYPWGEADFTS